MFYHCFWCHVYTLTFSLLKLSFVDLVSDENISLNAKKREKKKFKRLLEEKKKFYMLKYW